jgi:hypothetical protein
MLRDSRLIVRKRTKARRASLRRCSMMAGLWVGSVSLLPRRAWTRTGLPEWRQRLWPLVHPCRANLEAAKHRAGIRNAAHWVTRAAAGADAATPVRCAALPAAAACAGSGQSESPILHPTMGPVGTIAMLVASITGLARTWSVERTWARRCSRRSRAFSWISLVTAADPSLSRTQA